MTPDELLVKAIKKFRGEQTEREVKEFCDRARLGSYTHDQLIDVYNAIVQQLLLAR